MLRLVAAHEPSNMSGRLASSTAQPPFEVSPVDDAEHEDQVSFGQVEHDPEIADPEPKEPIPFALDRLQALAAPLERSSGREPFQRLANGRLILRGEFAEMAG